MVCWAAASTNAKWILSLNREMYSFWWGQCNNKSDCAMGHVSALCGLTEDSNSIVTGDCGTQAVNLSESLFAAKITP